MYRGLLCGRYCGNKKHLTEAILRPWGSHGHETKVGDDDDEDRDGIYSQGWLNAYIVKELCEALQGANSSPPCWSFTSVLRGIHCVACTLQKRKLRF